jgi:hypothetical protein
MEAVSLVLAHIDTVFAILFGLHAIALVIVNATDTPADDAALGKVYRVLEMVAGLFSLRAKQFPGEASVVEELKNSSESIAEVDRWLGR